MAASAAWGEDNVFPGWNDCSSRVFFPQARTRRDLVIKKTPADYRRRFAAAYRPAQRALQEAALAFSAFKTLPYREFLGDFLRPVARRQEDPVRGGVQPGPWPGSSTAGGGSAFPYLYLKMSDRFSNFLFDEFQDTSTLQFRALAPLIDEVLSREENASLFIVGDRKQAIYRWRGGNSELMEEGRLREEVPAIDQPEPGGVLRYPGQELAQPQGDRRLQQPLLGPGGDLADRGGTDLQQAIRGQFQGLAGRSFLPAAKRDGGYVELSLQVEAEEGGRGGGSGRRGAMSGRQLDEIEGIIHRLHDEHGYEYSDIAVLVRKNDQVRDIVRRLGRKRTIPTFSDQSLMLGSNPRVSEIIAFLRFLDYPPDDLNFHAFIDGGIFREAARRYLPGSWRPFPRTRSSAAAARCTRCSRTNSRLPGKA